MFRIGLSSLAASLLALSFGGGVAAAQTRIFVAAQGSDGNPCTFAAPCRTFQHAHDIAAAGGEIDVLDPAGYGAVSISKAISIQGHGFAGITATSGNAISIDADTGKVSLIGLLLDGAGSGTSGIVVNTGASLLIRDCVIRGFASKGIDIPTQTSLKLFVSNTMIVDNVSGIGSGPFAILIRATGSTRVTAVLDHVSMANNSNGFAAVVTAPATGTTDVTLVDCIVSNNSIEGVVANADAPGGVVVRLRRSTITGNAEAWRAVSSGQVLSFGDNIIEGNGANPAPPPATSK